MTPRIKPMQKFQHREHNKKITISHRQQNSKLESLGSAINHFFIFISEHNTTSKLNTPH